MPTNSTPMDKDKLGEVNAMYNFLTQAADLYRVANTILPQLKDATNIAMVKGLMSNLQPYYETYETARNQFVKDLLEYGGVKE